MFIQDLKNLWTFIRNINAARNQVFLSSRKETRKEKIVAPRFGGFTFNEKEVKKVNGLGNSSPTPPSSLSHSVSFATRSYPSQPPKGTAVSPTTKAEGRLKQPLQSILFVYTGHFYLPPAKTEGKGQKNYFAAAERVETTFECKVSVCLLLPQLQQLLLLLLRLLPICLLEKLLQLLLRDKYYYDQQQPPLSRESSFLHLQKQHRQTDRDSSDSHPPLQHECLERQFSARKKKFSKTN